MSVKIYPFFSSPVMIGEEIYKFSEKEINYVKNLKLLSNDFNQSSETTFVLENPTLASLKKFILKGINYYTDEVLKIKKDTTKFYITQSWISYTNPGQCHHLHLHPNSLLSGVFYFQGEKAPIQFHRGERLFPLTFAYEFFNLYNSDSCWVDLEIGKLFLFPSSLRHEVLINKSSIQRISLSFNTFASGEFGHTVRDSHLVIPSPKT